MTKRVSMVLAALAALVLIGLSTTGLLAKPPHRDRDRTERADLTRLDRAIRTNALRQLDDGRQIFRFDTFGDEAFWGDALRLQETIAGDAHGGIGPGLTPRTALELGLKVDSEALPEKVQNQLRHGEIDLDDPATTLALLQLNAVLGVTGFFDGEGQLRSVGIQCALCHSTVDDSLAPGVGRRLDGWANRDLNVGAIIAFAATVQPIADLLGTDEATVRDVLTRWGPGKFDAELLLDGKALRPDDGKPGATLIPPAFGLAGVNQHTWTGSWGTVSYWNAFVANLEMRGKGVFFDPRLDDPEQFPVAAAHPDQFGHKRDEVDLITAKLPALHFYQLAIPAPPPPEGSFDAAAAERGDALFSGKAQCTNCHVEPLGTEPGWNLHTAAEIGIDDFQSNRAPDRRYRTAPLAGLWTHQKGGFYHDGRFATLRDVVDHYDGFFRLGLTDEEANDVVEYLKSLPRAEEEASQSD
ncbi:MAG TPA: hypothetical protein VKA21_09775 [Candidatus Binatia bacterium]|nr:hypothetical protein [Candidatus Binatia bacterium]